MNRVAKRKKSSVWLKVIMVIGILMAVIGSLTLGYFAYDNYQFNQRNARLVKKALEKKKESKSDSNEVNAFEAKYGVPKAVLSVPKIKLKIGLYKERDSDQENNEILSNAATVLQHTDWVTGGIGKNAAVAAHSGLQINALFDQIDQLKKKDKFYIHVNGEIHTYQVDQIKKVLPDDTKYLARKADKDYITLITCTPKVINDHRLLVRGRRVPNETTEKPVKQKKASGLNREEVMLFVVASGVVLMIMAYVIYKGRGKKHED